MAGQAQPGPFGLQLIGGAELGHQGLPQCLVLAAGVGRAGPDDALQAGVVRAGFVGLLLVKLRQGLEQLGLQGLPVVRVQQQGVALGQGDALEAWGHGRLVLAAQALQVRQGQAKAGLGQQGAGVASGESVLQGLPGGLALGGCGVCGLGHRGQAPWPRLQGAAGLGVAHDDAVARQGRPGASSTAGASLRAPGCKWRWGRPGAGRGRCSAGCPGGGGPAVQLVSGVSSASQVQAHIQAGAGLLSSSGWASQSPRACLPGAGPPGSAPRAGRPLPLGLAAGFVRAGCAHARCARCPSGPGCRPR